MARINYLTRETASPELRAIFREGQPQHVPGLLAHAPANAPALYRMTASGLLNTLSPCTGCGNKDIRSSSGIGLKGTMEG